MSTAGLQQRGRALDSGLTTTTSASPTRPHGQGKRPRHAGRDNWRLQPSLQLQLLQLLQLRGPALLPRPDGLTPRGAARFSIGEKTRGEERRSENRASQAQHGKLTTRHIIVPLRLAGRPTATATLWPHYGCRLDGLRTVRHCDGEGEARLHFRSGFLNGCNRTRFDLGDLDGWSSRRESGLGPNNLSFLALLDHFPIHHRLGGNRSPGSAVQLGPAQAPPFH